MNFVEPCPIFSSNFQTTPNRMARLKSLLDRTGYILKQENGQRIYGPPPALSLPEPKKGSEVFVGRLPRFVFEDDLVPVFETVGAVYKVRLMMQFSGKTRGFAFVTYANPDIADLAVKHLNNFQLHGRYPICVNRSVDNCRLFVGGIPHDKTYQEIWNKLTEFVTGIVKLIMYPSNIEDQVNRGYVFVEFEDHRSAAVARRQLGSGMCITLWDTLFPVAVDWADPVPEVDQTVMNKVTKLYIRNIEKTISTDELKAHLALYTRQDTVTRICKMFDYAFVHFSNRQSAEYAYVRLQGANIMGRSLEVFWARPRMYSKTNRMNAPIQNFCTSVPCKTRRLVEIEKVRLRAKAESGRNSSFTSSSQSPSEETNGSNVNLSLDFASILDRLAQ